MVNTVTGTYDHNEHMLDVLTGLTRAERGALMSWLSRQGEPVQVETFRLQTAVLTSLREAAKEDANMAALHRQHRAELFLGAFALAINKQRHLDAALRRKGADPEAAAELVAHRVARIKARKRTKNAPEREKLRLQYFRLVRWMRGQGMSWREISAYLAEHHHQRWSHGWLRNTFEMIAQERLLAGIVD